MFHRVSCSAYRCHGPRCPHSGGIIIQVKAKNKEPVRTVKLALMRYEHIRKSVETAHKNKIKLDGSHKLSYSIS